MTSTGNIIYRYYMERAKYHVRRALEELDRDNLYGAIEELRSALVEAKKAKRLTINL